MNIIARKMHMQSTLRADAERRGDRGDAAVCDEWWWAAGAATTPTDERT